MENNQNVKVNEMDICPHNEFCGGCIYQELPYEEQLNIKENEVKQLLSDKKVEAEVFEHIAPSPDIYRYRNKMEYTFGDLVKDGEMTLGMHKKGHFMSIVTVDDCQLVHEDFNKILKATLDFAKTKGYEKYNKKSHKGLLRNLIIRKGYKTDEILVNIVTASDEKAGVNFDEKGYLDTIQSLKIENNLVGVLRTYCDTLQDAVVPDEVKTIWGRDYYNEEILGLHFKVSAFSFFQTNINAVERLYKEALDLIPGIEGKTVFDLYSGTGTIAQIMALKAKKVIGIEIVEEAVKKAEESAKINGLDNCIFHAGDVFKVLDTQVKETPDIIVVDPPRVGIAPKALDKIISYGVEEILYISCNPKTMADNLRYLNHYGYSCKYIKPYDNFSFTKHVEGVCLLSRIENKITTGVLHKINVNISAIE